MTMGIVSLNVGKPVTVDYQGRTCLPEFISSLWKAPCS